MFLLKRNCWKLMLQGGSTWGTANSNSYVSALSLMAKNFSTQADDISVISSERAPPGSMIINQSENIDSRYRNLPPLPLENTNPELTPIREAWIENMSTPNSIKLGMLHLHPRIFSVFPRPDIIQQNHRWETLYKYVDYRCMPTRAEVKGLNRKPWPQKGTGRARHSSRKAPMWNNGGWATGPRGPRTYFYMLSWPVRVAGLISMLSAKFSQNDLHVVDSFESFPLDGTAAHLEELCETRNWGPSVLFVDKVDIELAPLCTKAEHLFTASQTINHINIVPAYSLSVYSMLKHETLVLTVDAIKDIENKLLTQLKRVDLKNVFIEHKGRTNWKK